MWGGGRCLDDYTATQRLMSRWVAWIVWILGQRNDCCYRAVFHHVTKNGTQLRTWKFFTSGISHSRFLDCRKQKPRESKTAAKGGSYHDAESGAIEVILRTLKAWGVFSGGTRSLMHCMV